MRLRGLGLAARLGTGALQKLDEKWNQIIMTSEKVTLNGGLVMFSKGIPPNPLHSAIGIIVLCPDCMVISWIRWILKMLIFMMRHLRLTTFSCAVCSSICGLMSILFYLDFLVEVVKPPVLVTTSKLWAINSLAMVHEIHDIHFNPDRKPKEDLSRSE